MPQEGVKVIAQNRKARHDYFVEETYEAGIELHGTEVKSIRLGQCNLKDCFAVVKDGELFVYGMHVSPYEKGSFSNTDPLRPKRLLMNGRVKAQVALCRGKKLYDKRDDMARRDAQRDIERTFAGRG